MKVSLKFRADVALFPFYAPEDISVFGYNDDDIASIADVPVSTVHMPMYEMGCRAASPTFELLHHERSDQPLCLPVTLAIRASSAKRAGSERPVLNRL
ncbi:MAG: substrate-binding domain-containing protein [Oscillospiraceae bacterium]|nr:substrate-binding domain-containing protein [Oscillospiraceae bacterium]